LIINTIPLSGWVAAKERTTAKIGPIHGVHPMEKAIPIKNDPINPVGLFLKVSCLFFIKNLKLKTPTITKPKKIIKMAPIWRIISCYIIKKSEMSVAVNPIIINTLENPSKNKIVCNIALLESFVLSLFSSLTLIPVIYDKNAGNNGRTHGEIKDKNPAP